MTRKESRRSVTVLPGAGETGRVSPAALTAGLRDARGARPPHRAHRGGIAAADRDALRDGGATIDGAPA
jgi:hypothetical protein